MNHLFKTMPEAKDKINKKKKTKSTNNSIVKDVIKNNSRKNTLKASRKKRNTPQRAEIQKEVKDMFQLELQKHFQQTDVTDKADKSSFMDFKLGK